MALRKPTPKKLPKKPKSNASADAWAKWETKATEIRNANRKALAEFNKNLAKREGIKKRASNLGAL